MDRSAPRAPDSPGPPDSPRSPDPTGAPLTAYIKTALAPILWGGSLVAGRYVAEGLPAVMITWIRFGLVALVLIPTLRIIEGRLARPSYRGLILLFALTTTGILLFNLFLFSGLKTVTATRSSILIAFAPSAVALILYLFFREKRKLHSLIGVFIAFAGATVTITNGDLSGLIAEGVQIGDLFLIGCVVSWAFYTILARYAMREMTALTVLTYSSALGAVFLTPFALSLDPMVVIASISPASWGALAYLSIGAAGIAYLLYYQGIRDIGAHEAAVFLNLEPVSAIVLGVLLLGEQLTVPVLVGAVLVITGLYLVNRP